MSIFYLDHELGNDANNGSTWALAWKTITSGATAARIAPGDTIRIAKSPAPARIGASTCKWTSGPLPATVAIGSSTNAAPIVVTKTVHGFVNGDIVQVVGHTTNTNANGVWIVANKTDNTFELAGSVGNGTGGATGTLQLINAKTVVLDAAVTQTIDNCEVAWTANGSGDASVGTLAVSSTKQGNSCVYVQLDASPQTSTMQAYKATGALNLSSYQKLSFWINPNSAITANQWNITLCSNADGTGVVDTFEIPALPAQGRWVPLTIARTGGGNLGASIQSIAINSGSSAPAASKWIQLDNIIACTTDGLNLQSLISKTSTEQGVTEGWYGIQSIDATVVLLDNETNTVVNAGRGYYGTSESVATYKRETIKTAMASAASTFVQEPQETGGASSKITFSGGWNITNTIQDGITLFDGLNGNGWGLRVSLPFIIVESIGTYRYNYGTVLNSYGCVLSTGHVGGNNTGAALLLNSANNCLLDVKNGINNGSYGTLLSSSNENVFTHLDKQSGTVVGHGIAFSGAHNNTVNSASGCNNNSSFQIYFAGSSINKINNAVMTGSTNACTSSDNPDYNAFYNSTFNGATEVEIGIQMADVKVLSQNHDNTAGNHQIFTDYGLISSEATVRHTASGLAWKLAVTLSLRTSAYPLILRIARVYLVGGQSATIKAYLKKTHATDTEGAIRCRNVLVSAVYTDYQSSAMAANTDWQELTLTFTPDNTGVYDIEALAWWVANTADESVYVDDMTLPTGVATATLDIVADAQPWCQNAPAGGGTPVTTAYAFLGG